MEFWVLHGSDDEAIRTRREELLAAAPAAHESVDLADEPLEALLNALSSPSLFAPRRVVALEGIASLDERALGRVAEAARNSDAYVVSRAETLTAAQLKVIRTFATDEKRTQPRNAAVRDRVREIAVRHGVTLSPAVERVLVRRCGHDLSRAASVCTQLSLATILNPTERQVEVLLGSTAPDGVPWSVTDALERGDSRAALAAARDLEPMAVLAYLSNQLTLAQVLHETAPADRTAVAGTPFAKERASWWEARLRDSLPAALSLMARADALAKGPAGAENALALAIGSLAQMLHRP